MRLNTVLRNHSQKQNFLFVLVTIIALTSCRNDSSSVLTGSNQSTKPYLISLKEHERKIRFLYVANGGIRAYFDDGTIAGCPRCEISKENIESLYQKKPFQTYKYEKGELLIIETNEKELPRTNADGEFYGWAMIDYKWLISIQCRLVSGVS